ncbi:MAG: DUF1501 domain-containing protein [Planctomycetota bacterium]|nr:DUF1501 domain-containing protein [Planctomycetota bacterium]
MKRYLCTEFRDGVTRRGLLQAGLGGVIGLSMPDLLRLQAATSERSEQKSAAPLDTAVIYLEQAGGPTQHETYDPKPNAPAEYRGPLSAIPTALPGVSFCEVMPMQAAIADRLAIIRSMHHDSGSHGTSSHLTQTGYYLNDRQNRNNEMPCIGSFTTKLRGANEPGVPAFVSIPLSMRFGRAAWLGKGNNPFETSKSADDTRFEVPNLTLLSGLDQDRLTDRRQLLSGFDASRRIVDNHGAADATDDFTRQAFEMVTGDAARSAFAIDEENDATRDRYGRNSIGQNVLLAKRLVERGVTFVTVRANTLGSWDDHGGIAARMKAKGPGFDQAVAALVGDLYDSGLDRKVMVVAMGEFGRTPRINRNAGRDHWGQVMSVMLSGGGLKVGQVIGASDSHGGTPVESPYRPENVLAVLYRHLGIDSSLTFPDNAGRPRYLLERRELISELI